MSGGILGAFANAPPKGSRPKPKPEDENRAGYRVPLNKHALTVVPPPKKDSLPPKPVAKISAKRQQELDDINRMMEEDDEPQGPPQPSTKRDGKVKLSRTRGFSR